MGYRIVINNDRRGNLTWSLLFDKDNSEYSNADVDRIFGVAREFVKALSTLQQQGKAQPEGLL